MAAKHPDESLMKKLNVLEVHVSKADVYSFNTTCFYAELNNLYRDRYLTDQQFNERLQKVIERLKKHLQHEKRILNMLIQTSEQIQNSAKIH